MELQRMEQQHKTRIVSRAALITGVFSVAVALLLLLNMIHIRGSKPLESESMKVLIERLAEDPMNDGLKKEIRNFDLLARKAFFTSQWQVRTGAFLLLFGAIALVAFLKIRKDLTDKIEPPFASSEDPYLSRFMAQRWMQILVAILFLSALAASWLTDDWLHRYETGDIPVIAEKAPVNSQVEVVKLIGVIPEPLQPTEDVPKVDAPAAATGNYPSLADLRANFPTFRGPWGSSQSTHKNIPVSWDGPSGKNIIWKVEIPLPGFNSPVWWGDRLFVSGANSQKRMIYCYNRNTGTLLWEKPVDNIPGSPATPPKVTEDTGLAAPSLCTDGQRVYGIFGTGDLIALDVNGNRLWAKNLGAPDNHYGHSSSLISWQNKLIIQYDTNQGGRLLAVDVLTGNIIWDMKRTSKISWASPIIAEVNGKLQVITSSSPPVAGHDLETGKLLWTVDCLMGEVGPSPVFGSGLVYASNEYARLVAIKPGAKPEIIWEADEYLPEVASLAFSDGLLFLATSYGIVVCHDAKTGEKLWEDDSGTGFYGSPMISDGKMYIVNMKGKAFIYKVSRELQAVGQPVLGENSVVTPVFAPGRIYLRGDKYLYCIGS